MGKDQFVVRNGDQWAVRGVNNQRVTAIFPTQAEAIKVATGIAKNQQSELRVQDRHGKFKNVIAMVMILVHRKIRIYNLKISILKNIEWRST